VAAVGRQYVEQCGAHGAGHDRAAEGGRLDAGHPQRRLSPGIAPLAAHLGIARIEAVDLYFDAAGDYAGYDTKFPTTRSGGKPERIAALKRELAPARTVMVGDGVSDLETKPGG
jgi:phosphoserine phosphatase